MPATERRVARWEVPTSVARAIGPVVRVLMRALSRSDPRVRGHRVILCTDDEPAALQAVDAALTVVERDAPTLVETLRRYLEGFYIDHQPAAHGIRDGLWHLCRLDADRLLGDPPEVTATMLIRLAQPEASRAARHN